ncbi:sex peptide receptor-like [Mytilus trossulus]|uniref:sex peptide receptor-like n=1 Tax=Mytilus trossulus TaxID=6551 RepID=UPI003004414A
MAVDNTTSNNEIGTLPFLDLGNIYPIDYAGPIYGYLSPIVICLTVITNSFACVVLMQKNMRSPTNIILAGLAISDMCTGIFLLPLYIYFYSFEHYLEKVPIDWCVIYFNFGLNIPVIFHTTSVWLTVTLAIHRYVYVCSSSNVRQNCTMRNIAIVILIVFCMSIICNCSSFVEDDIIQVDAPSNINPNDTIRTCTVGVKPWLYGYVDIYYSLRFLFRAIFIQLIPCTVLLVMNVLLTLKITKANRRRRQMVSKNRSSESINRTNQMLIIVVAVFLIAELPTGIIFILQFIQNTFENIFFFNTEEAVLVSILANFFIFLSFPINFFIYCGMSTQFRKTFKKTIKRN